MREQDAPVGGGEARAARGALKVDGDMVNFFVYYECDDDTSAHS